MQDFKKLKVWEKSFDFSFTIYELTKTFPKDEIYGITSQLRRCSLSISTNIAEGCGRSSHKELIRFLNIALGSVNETESLLLMSKKLKYVPENYDSETLISTLISIRKMLLNFVDVIKMKNSEPATRNRQPERSEVS